MKHKFLCIMLVLLFVSVSSYSIRAEQYDINSIKGGFMLLYDSEWRLFNLNYRLFAIIDKEFDIYTRSMAFGTSSFQLALNRDNIIEKIQSDILDKFRPVYEEFLKSFQSKYYRLLQTNPQKYSIEKIQQAPSYEVIETLQHEGEQKMLKNIASMFDKKLYKELSTPYFSALWLILGLSILISQSFIAKYFYRRNHVKLARMVLAVVGLVVLSFGTFHVSRGIFFTQGLTRDFLNEQTKILYTSQLPDIYWNTLEAHVQGALN